MLPADERPSQPASHPDWGENSGHAGWEDDRQLFSQAGFNPSPTPNPNLALALALALALVPYHPSRYHPSRSRSRSRSRSPSPIPSPSTNPTQVRARHPATRRLDGRTSLLYVLENPGGSERVEDLIEWCGPATAPR